MLGRDVLVRLATAFAALVAGAAAIVVAVRLVDDAVGTSAGAAAGGGLGTAPVAATRTATVPVAPAGFPAPPRDAVVLAREAGSDVLAVAVVARAQRRLVQVSILGQDALGVDGATVSVGSGRATRCGRGCYRAIAAGARGPLDLRARISGRVFTWRVSLPAGAPSADAFAARATAVFDSLRSVAWTDVLGSNERYVTTTEWRAAAPDRLAYEVRNGPAAVIVGATRWDKFTPSSSWQRSQQSYPAVQPRPLWATEVDAHIVGHTTVDGHEAVRVSFFDPETPGWYELLVEPSTMRTLHMDMFAAAHFMHDTYSAFDAAPAIVPPDAN